MAIPLIDITNIKETLYPLSISDTDYITKNIEIYRKKSNTKYYKVSQYVNKHNGYMYAGIKCKDSTIKNRRVHRLMAQTFISNPDSINLPIVGHKNNIKTDDRIENLYWTTSQENTQKAVDDKLLVNPKGVKHNQSKVVQVLDLQNNLVAVYGSIREAARHIDNIDETYISKTIRSIDKDYKPRNKNYKYFLMSKEDFLHTDIQYKFKHLVEKLPGNKKPKVFRATNIQTNEVLFSDNQKAFAREHNLYQSRISYALLHPNEEVDTGTWKFELIKEKEYIDGSGYKNMINLTPEIKVQNIHTNKELIFKTIAEMKQYFNLKGHDIAPYLKQNMLLFSQWKVTQI